jgi:hypothetical protein
LRKSNEPILYVSNVRRLKELRDHPLTKVTPFIRSVAYIPVSSSPAAASFDCAITVVDPRLKWPFPSPVSAAALDIAILVGELLELAADAPGSAVAPARSLEEPGGDAPLVPGEPTSRFLVDTLVRRQVLKTRNDLFYITTRAWSSPIKAHQIKALRALKKSPPPDLVAAAADDIATAARRIYGTPMLNCVVPVPCGHSRGECFSELLARAVAERLEIDYVAAFERRVRPGTSHPKKSAALPPLVQKQAVRGTALLVDDLATSGRHLEQASEALRKSCKHVVALAWIGA